MQLAIVLPLPDHIAHEVVKIQLSIFRRHGPHEGMEAHPHVTLKMGYPAADTAPSEAYLEQLAARMPELPLEIDGFDAFEEGILFLNVKPDPALESWRLGILRDLKSMHGVVPAEVEDDRFRFHVTVASGLSARDFERVRAEFLPQRIGFQFKASRIELLCHTGCHWVVCRRLELGRPDETLTQIGGRP